MIGLVFVSHSPKLAEGVVELAAQLGGGRVRMVAAGGMNDAGGALGTDPVRVMEAIDEAWSEDGVLVLMDLGSAVLSAEMALELLPEERRRRVALTAAPLVEGAVAAAVAAGLGEPLDVVAAEARRGLAAKREHLGEEAAPLEADPAPSERTALETSAQPRTLRLRVENPLGLHARPAAALVRTAGQFDAAALLTNLTAGRGPASARSLNGVGTLGVRCGDELLVEASGAQADELLAAVAALAREHFGEPVGEGAGEPAKLVDARSRRQAEAAAQPPRSRQEAGGAAQPSHHDEGALGTPPAGAVVQGIPASPGIAVGQAWHLHVQVPEIPTDQSVDPAADWIRLQEAIAAAAREITAARTEAEAATREEPAAQATAYDTAILDAHVLFLSDEALLSPARDRLFTSKMNPALAWWESVQAAAAEWDALDEPYQRMRAADVREVGEQVLRHLLGLTARTTPAQACIALASDLSPTDLARIDRTLVRGIASAAGGPTSHGAIMARSLGLPAVVGAGASLLLIPDATVLELDGEAGTVVVDPSSRQLRAAERRQAERERVRAAARAAAHLPSVTRDGVAVHFGANLAEPGEAHMVLEAGADSVGLFRTEFMFLDAPQMPSEEEQELAYRSVAQALGGRPLTLRTLGAGADKPLPYLALESEQNPFLGVRGVRVGLLHKELLATQLRAVLRVAADYPIRIMLPMVTTLDEVLRAREILDEARASLAAAGVATPRRIEVGIMVEVPAVALTVDSFLPHVDFFSLGTNDLAQYVLAADRGNAQLAGLADAMNPAVLSMIRRVAESGAEGGRPVAVCGELAGDSLATPLLIGLGIRELSMSCARIPAVKQAVRAADSAAAAELAGEALRAASAGDVRRLCAEAVR